MAEEEQYIDRKMMKWMPFNALLEQGEHLRELIAEQNKENKPSLSEDQYAILNYDLQVAYMSQTTVEVHYFQNHKRKTVKGIISHIDVQNKMILIGKEGLYAEDVLEIVGA